MDNRAEWLQKRKTGIGGSDAAAVLGMSKYKTPLDVYAEKVGDALELEDNGPMLWGRLLEPVIRQRYADETGRAVAVPPDILRHASRPFMIATPDGITDDGRLLEIKTSRTADGWGTPGTDEIPTAYLLQVQHYLAVTALPVADVAALIGGSDYRLYYVEADAELQAMLVDAEAEFWARVERREPPPPVTYADAVARFGKVSKSVDVIADPDADAAVSLIRAAQLAIKEAEGAIDSARAVICAQMGDADTLRDAGGNILATWKTAKSANRFDSAAFKAAHPDLFAQFSKPGEPSRRFLIK